MPLFVVGLALLFSILVTFFVNGGMHGMYVDDYSVKVEAVDLATGSWRPRLTPSIDFRFVKGVITPNVGNLLPDNEWLARLIILTLHLANVAMVALLIWRLTHARAVALIGGALFLVPVFANQALLWFTSALDNTPALFFNLLGFHLLLSAGSGRRTIPYLLGGIAAWCLAVMFYESGIFVYLLLPVFGYMFWLQGERVNPKTWLAALIGVYLILIPYAFLVLQSAARVSGRTSTNVGFLLLTRVPEVFGDLVNTFTAPQVHELLGNAFSLGYREWISSIAGILILGAASITLALVPITYPTAQERIASPRQLFLLFAAGIGWIVLSLLPVVLVRGQVIEIRILYTPMVGAALAMAGIIGLMFSVTPRQRSIRIRLAMLLVAVIVFISSLTVAGLVKTYQLRWALDQKQLDALRSAIPQLDASRRIWLLPVQLRERTVRPYFEQDIALDYYLGGVFETTWSGAAAVQLAYHRGDIVTGASNRRSSPRISAIKEENGRVTNLAFIDTFSNNQQVPVNRLIAFTYQQNHVILFDSITIAGVNSDAKKINLPLAGKFASETAERQTLELTLGKP